MHEPAVLITCEHAVNTVPGPWRNLFAGDPEILQSHRGWDPGALELAIMLAETLSAPCFAAGVSRLLIDLNRSPNNRALWSDISRGLPVGEKEKLLAEHYTPFRETTSSWIAARQAEDRKIIHVSVHSFTPVLDGHIREVDIGLLYDPERPEEAYFSSLWKSFLNLDQPRLRVRFNAPYLGRNDSHLTAYRELYKSRDYVGIELEVNQALVEAPDRWPALQRRLAESLRSSLQEICLDE